MELNFKFYPCLDQPDSLDSILILHGLFGSSKNWVSVSKHLSRYFNVYALDLRNHGDSPHSEIHSIPEMAKDVEEFIQTHKLTNLHILGHSMGGLVAMYFDLHHQNLLKSLVIQDIAPRNYPFIYENEIASMSFDLSLFRSRAEIDEKMKEYVPDSFIRQFLQMNLERTLDGKYVWKLNVNGIGKSDRVFLEQFENVSPSQTKSLFLLGGSSEYITESDRKLIGNLFPNARLETIPEGGHFIHFTHATNFLAHLDSFYNRL